MKHCKKCHIYKEAAEFGFDRSRPDSLNIYCKECVRSRYKYDPEYHKAYANKNAVTIGQYQKQYRQNNGEKLAEAARRYHIANADIIRARVKKWREDNPERYREGVRRRRAENLERFRRYANEWVKRNPGKANELTAKRRVAEFRAMPIWVDRKKIRAIYVEAARLTRETGIPHAVDHIVPLRSKFVCGLHWHGNLQILTKSENSTKGNRSWPDM